MYIVFLLSASINLYDAGLSKFQSLLVMVFCLFCTWKFAIALHPVGKLYVHFYKLPMLGTITDLSMISAFVETKILKWSF